MKLSINVANERTNVKNMLSHEKWEVQCVEGWLDGPYFMYNLEAHHTAC